MTILRNYCIITSSAPANPDVAVDVPADMVLQLYVLVDLKHAVDAPAAAVQGLSDVDVAFQRVVTVFPNHQ